MMASAKVLKAVRLEMKRQAVGIDALEGLSGIAIFVNFPGPGRAEVEFKPQLRGRIDLTEHESEIAKASL